MPAARADCDDDDGNPVLSPKSHKYGKSLTQWTEMYWRWSYEDGGMTATEPCRPTKSKLVFMPLPAGEYLGGSFTSDDPGILQGTIEVTIKRDTPFYLPCFVWISETYNTGQDDDPPIPNDRIKGVAGQPRSLLCSGRIEGARRFNIAPGQELLPVRRPTDAHPPHMPMHQPCFVTADRL